MTNKDEKIKSSIIKAAENLFQKYGINKTTMEDIAKESRKAKSTLYYYFKNKEEIFDAVLIKEMNEIFQIVIDAVSVEKDFEGKMRAYVITDLREIKKRVNLYSIVKSEIVYDEHFIKKFRESFDTRDVNFITEIIEYGVKNQELRPLTDDEIKTLSHIILIAFRSIELDLFIEHKFLNDDEKIDSLLNILYYGIKK